MFDIGFYVTAREVYPENEDSRWEYLGLNIARGTMFDIRHGLRGMSWKSG